MSTLAIVPARSGSKGIPGKNLRQLGGKTLIAHAVECALEIGCVPVVSTDYAAGFYDDTRIWRVQRPPELSQDDTPMIDVVKHVLAEVPGPDDQILVLLQPTQPFRTPAHVTAAIALLQETQADSVVSVVELPQTYSPDLLLGVYPSGWMRAGSLGPWLDTADEEYSHDWDARPTRRQNARIAYRADGTCYAFRRSTVNVHGTIYGKDVRPLIVSPVASCELDTELDWHAVEARWRAQHG